MFGKSRGEKKAEGKLGYVAGGKSVQKSTPFRSKKLEGYIKHYEDRAYDHLRDWFDAVKSSDHVPIRQRKPFMRMNIVKMMAGRLAAKLAGQDVFPDLNISDDPDTEYYFKLIVRTSLLQAALVSACRPLIVSGSVFIRFYIVGSVMKVEHYNSNYCYPEFDETGNLASCRVQYVFTDYSDKDDQGTPKKKWYRADFGTQEDVLYDNPVYKEDVEPLFQVMSAVEHGLGFVQGEWFVTHRNTDKIDGFSLVEDAIPFIDSMNYSLSLSQESTDYNTNPQLAFKGMDEDEMEGLIRSNQRAWSLGREGEGHFLESTMNGVNVSMEMRDKVKQFVQDLTRIILLDPEKIIGSAQSGKAMEILHGPMVDLIGELRPQFGANLSALIMKMGVANIIALRTTGVAPVMVPPDFEPASMDLQLDWPPVFPQTTLDLQQKVSMVAAAVNANLISRRTGVKQLAKDFGVEDVELELQEIINQPKLSMPFGMF